jgi:hypothetical protein
MSSPTVTEDGYEWFQRAGFLWGTYRTIQSYIGFGSTESVISFAARHNLKRIKPCQRGLTDEEVSFARDKYFNEIAEATFRLVDLMRCDNYEKAA